MRRCLSVAAAVLALMLMFTTANTYAEPRSPGSPTSILRGQLPYGTDCNPLSTGDDYCVTPGGDVYICPGLDYDTVCTLWTGSRTLPTSTPTRRITLPTAPTSGVKAQP